MTVHLEKIYSDHGEYSTDSWCGKNSAKGQLLLVDDLAQVDCESCLEAAHSFGQRCWARRVELARAAVEEMKPAIWDEQIRQEQAKEPRPVREAKTVTTVTVRDMLLAVGRQLWAMRKP